MKKVIGFLLLIVVFLSMTAFVMSAEDDSVVIMPDGKVSIPFTKTWDDNHNSEGKRPDSISVTLSYYQGENDTTGKHITKTVTGDSTADKWTYTFELLDTETDPLFYGDGLEPVIFKISEESLDSEGYSTVVNKDPAIAMTAVFPGENNRHTRCDELDIPIDIDGEEKSWVAIKKGSSYYIWTPEELSPIEKKIIHNAACTINGFHSEESKLETFLTGYGKEVLQEVGIGFTVSDGSDGNDPVLSFDKKCNWSIVGWGTYTRSIESNNCSITNKYVPKIDVTVKKVWEDDNDRDGARPDTVQVQLLAYGEPVEGKVLTLSAESAEPWTGSFTGLLKYADGEEIEYTVEEVKDGNVITGTDGPGTYSVEVAQTKTDDGEPVANAYTVTNKHTPEETEVTVTKVWDDDEDRDGARPDTVQVQLLADDEPVEGKVLTLSAEGAEPWTGSFTGLLKYADGEEIEYTVEEVKDGNVITGTDGPGTYSVEVTQTKTEDGEPVASAYTITNKHTPEKIKITVTKEWSDVDDQDGIRPTSVEVQLLADGEPVEGKVLTLSAEDAEPWTGSFTELLKYADGEEIEYTVEEVKDGKVITGTDGAGTYKIETKAVEGGFKIINRHTPETITISVSKVWVDENDADGIRPEKVNVQLYADGVAVADEVLTLAKNNGWKASFSDLPKCKDGIEIVYTVDEVRDNVITGQDGPKTYKVDIKKSDDGFTITNTHTPEDPDVPTPPNTDDASDLRTWFGMMLTSALLLGVTLVMRKHWNMV